MKARERIVIEEGVGERDVVVRERVGGPFLLGPMESEFAGTGPGRGAWEAAQALEVDYIPPVRRAA